MGVLPIELAVQRAKVVEVDTETLFGADNFGEEEGREAEVDNHALVDGLAENGTEEGVVALAALHDRVGVGVGVERVVVVAQEEPARGVKALVHHLEEHLAAEASTVDAHLHHACAVEEGHVETLVEGRL